jgi:thioredoxin reductase (NADPH)
VTGTAETPPTAALFILIGTEPHTGRLANKVEHDDQGFIVTGRDLLRDHRPHRAGRWTGPRCQWNQPARRLRA